MRARKLASQERVHRPDGSPDGRPDGRSGEFARYQRVAPLYDLLDLPFEYGRYRALRRRMFEGLFGAILDAGIGTGRNMPFYPAGATVVGIDLSPAMLARAARRRERLGKQVGLRKMDPLRRFAMRLWAPWVRRVYGAAFDRDTEHYLPEAGLEGLETRFLYKDIVKLIVARPARGRPKRVVPSLHAAYAPR